MASSDDLDDALAESLDVIDRVLAEDDVPLTSRPRRAAQDFVRFCVIEVKTDSAAGPAARRTDAASRKLLHFLRRGVNAGRLICPISADLFMELTKQANAPTRRQATASLIDELSLGVTSMDPQTLLATEVHRFLSAALRCRASWRHRGGGRD